jgi:rhodanese-related sulfurtransferase
MQKKIIVGVVIIMLVIAGIALSRQNREESSDAQTEIQLVSATQFKEKLQATPGAVVVDVRTPSEYASGHIPQALNIDFRDPNFAAAVQKLDTTVPYFVYCHSGNRSAQAVAIMKRAGMTNITELRGGISAAPELLTLEILTAQPATENVVIDIGASTSLSMVLSASASTNALSSGEQAGLVYMREEEKLAHDVYLTLGTVWDVPIFSNIANSEQTHTNAIKVLLQQYAITDPVTDTTVGVFTNPEIQKLYTDLVATGKKSLLDAFTVGATIEDLDIHDLKANIAQTSNPDIKVVYENLTKGSRNHLRSFYGQLISRGGSYQAQYISATEFTEIITSDKESGNGMMGHGAGGRP